VLERLGSAQRGDQFFLSLFAVTPIILFRLKRRIPRLEKLGQNLLRLFVLRIDFERAIQQLFRFVLGAVAELAEGEIAERAPYRAMRGQ